jgi:hypothetical protein
MGIEFKGAGAYPTGKTNYEQHLVSKPVVASTSIEKKISGQSPGPVGTTEVINPGIFATEGVLCSVTVGGGRTLNLGNYESARIEVSITIPCNAKLITEAYDWGTDFVSKKIEDACSGMGK